MLTGAAPFGERDSASILARELQGDVDLSSYQPEIADWLRRGLSASPDDRFADAAADAGGLARGGSGRLRARAADAVVAALVRPRRARWRGRRVDGRFDVHVVVHV